MFTQKQSALFERKASVSQGGTATATVDSPFVKAGMKKSAETLSGNGALKYKTTGDHFVDQFGKLGGMKKPRPFQEIAADCEQLWSLDKRLAIVFMLYIRMITRVVSLFNGLSTSVAQKGAELRHEGIMRMIWLHTKQQDSFWKNIGLFVSVGSWKDIVTMLQYDLVYNGWKGRVLNWERFGHLMLSGLKNEKVNNLIKKYLPQIKANSACTTVEAQADNLIAKWICSLVFGSKESSYNYKQYRKLKTSGTAHDWQKLISQRKFDEVNFESIHGRALNLLVKSKFLKNHNLVDKYTKWITKADLAVKYTGFVHELFKGLGANGAQSRSVPVTYRTLVSMPVHEQETINKQFTTLVTKAGENPEQSRLIVVRDTSGSMGSEAPGTEMSCYAVAKALALYFSYFLKGRFQDAWIEFNEDAQMHKWQGNTPLERWFNDNSGFVGSTNFQSVVNLFVQIKNHTGVPESEFPTGILCISDGEFNPGMLGKTNVDTALWTLRDGGFSEEYVSNFVIALWNLENKHYGARSGVKFETHGEVQNVFYFSGYSAATVSFLTGKIKTARELFDEAMNQEILQMVEL